MKNKEKNEVLYDMLDEFTNHITSCFAKENDERGLLLAKILVSLSEVAKLHYSLQKLEAENRFEIQDADAMILRDIHYKALGEFMELPKESKSSLYEKCTILCIKDILDAHSKPQ